MNRNPENRAIVRRLHSEGKSQREIAARLGLTRTGVQHHLGNGKRGRGYMDQALEVEERTRKVRRMYSRGMTKSDIAARMGISRRTVTEYTRGMEPPAAEIQPLPDVETPCSTHPNPDMWFALEATVMEPAVRHSLTVEAKEICSECPLVNECLRHALDAKIDHGVWGGLTAYERKQLRRRSRAA